ncbi:MAG: hypothetical protein H8E42_02205 [Nitrospinae bacterium]|nr:hypothetical protein [Nitrospinota bacterium]MBL7019546.1 hypothetical protein [Nitrospinaceae bacterium]
MLSFSNRLAIRTSFPELKQREHANLNNLDIENKDLLLQFLEKRAK